jgi:hypothetical protein
MRTFPIIIFKLNQMNKLFTHRFLSPRYAGFAALLFVLLAASLLLLVAATPAYQQAKSINWKIRDTTNIGGVKPGVLGSPAVVRDKTGTSLQFDGVDDGLIIPVNPISGWQQFTVEVLVNPAADGPEAPRFVHFEDPAGRRGTLEMRVTPQGNWYLDTFLKNGAADKGLTLIKAENLHPCGKWYWIALVYDGKTMTDYVNGIKELDGQITLDPMSGGRISLGVRLNKVNWFKGLIREMRFHPEALNSTALQQP